MGASKDNQDRKEAMNVSASNVFSIPLMWMKRKNVRNLKELWSETGTKMYIQGLDELDAKADKGDINYYMCRIILKSINMSDEDTDDGEQDPTESSDDELDDDE
jgi:hypothetical protein